MIDIEGPRSLWSVPTWSHGPELYKKAKRGSHGEQVSKQPSVMASASVPASRFLLPCIRALISPYDGL